MEWREQSAVSCQDAYVEAQRWIEAVTKKTFKSKDFRSALENGVLLCDLINKIRPGTIRRINRLPTPIAGLDNINVFLKACLKLGLKEAQLFHPGDLQDLSSRVTVNDEETDRRLKNVLITLYWLSRRAEGEHSYDGPYLNIKAFEGLLGTALHKALQELSSQKGKSIQDSGLGDSWYSEREELHDLRGRRGGHRRDDSLDSLDSLSSQPFSISSDITLKGSSEGCCSDAESDAAFKMAGNKESLSYRRSVTLTPKVTTQFNQFLPSKDKTTAYVPAPLRKKRAERNDDNRRSWANPTYEDEDAPIVRSPPPDKSPSLPSARRQWCFEYESGSDSEPDRPDPDLVTDDLASRRFRNPSPAPPANFSVPVGPSFKAPGGPRAGVAPSRRIAGSGDAEEDRPARRPPVSTVSLFSDPYPESEDEDDEVGYADPVQDDLYARKVGVRPTTAGDASHHKFLPKLWTPEEDVHVQKIQRGSQKGAWYKKMQGFSQEKSGSSSDDSEPGVPPPCQLGVSRPRPFTARSAVVVEKRQRQASESFDGSKSTSDITEEPPLVRRQSQYEALEKYREQVKEGDDKWQDDLSKWKNRRKSVNSDIVKKKEEREEIEKVTNTGIGRRPKTYQEMQDDREFRRSYSIGSRMSSLSFDKDGDVFEKPKPRARESLSRSYTVDTVDTVHRSSGSSEVPKKKESPPDVPLASTKPKTSDPDSTNVRVPFPRTRPAESTSSFRSSALESSTVADKIYPPPRSTRIPISEPNSQAQAQPPSSASIYRPPPTTKTEGTAAAVSRISTSLPRSYQRSDSARLTSVVTPRPFGSQTSRVTSLTRTVALGDTNSRLNGNTDFSKNSQVPSRYHQFMTAEDRAQSQPSPVQSSDDDDDDEQEEMTGKSLTATSTISSLQVEKEYPTTEEPGKERSCEMRISLNQKPNSSRDFGFDVAWDSTGVHVKSVQPGSPAEMFQLESGDEVLTVNGQQVTDLRYLDWKDALDRALQEGSLVMDIRRHGKSSFPETANVANTLDFTSMADDSAKTATRSVVDVASNGVDGGYPKVSLTAKESEPISMINLKRRSEFFEKGGSDSTMPEIAVPPLTASSTRWAWDPEEERKRQEKWQKEQERQLQEKYKRDQEKLQEEWTKAQQEISSSASQFEQPAGPTLAYRELELQRERLEEERRRRQEQEEQDRLKLEVERKLREEEFERHRQEMRRREEELEREKREVEMKRREQEQELERQRQEMRRREEELERLKLAEEERRKREEEEERRRRREAEEEEERRRRREAEEEEERRRRREAEEEEERRRRREVEEEEERRRRREKEEEERRQREEEELLWQRRREAEKEEMKRRMAAVEEQQWHPEERGVDEQWAKSLEGEERLQSRGIGDVTDAAVASHQPTSQAELQRQQLLSDMKKKNNLLTDGSWIRQRSATAPGGEPPSTRRGGSREGPDYPFRSWRSSWTPAGDSFIPNFSRPHSALSGSSSFYDGRPPGALSGSSTLAPSLRGPAAGSAPWSRQSFAPSDAGARQQQYNRSVSGKKVCTLCGAALGKGAAMIIESLGLCYHLTCFKCIDCKTALGGSEAGAEVRIRNKQLYCNTCYMQFKTGHPTTM